MTKQEFINWAKSRGWREDKFGHLQKETDGKQYRFKVSKIAVRYEIKSMGKDVGWIRLRSGYFKDLSFTPDGKLSGVKT